MTNYNKNFIFIELFIVFKFCLSLTYFMDNSLQN